MFGIFGPNERINDDVLVYYIQLDMTVMHQSGTLCLTFAGGAMGEVGTPKDFRYHYGPGLELLEYGFKRILVVLVLTLYI